MPARLLSSANAQTLMAHPKKSCLFGDHQRRQQTVDLSNPEQQSPAHVKRVKLAVLSDQQFVSQELRCVLVSASWGLS
jgi:hypothetical protein